MDFKKVADRDKINTVASQFPVCITDMAVKVILFNKALMQGKGRQGVKGLKFIVSKQVFSISEFNPLWEALT